MIHRLIAVVEIVDLALVMSMAGDCAEAIVFWDGSRKVFPFILTKGAVTPRKQRFLALTVDAWSGDDFVDGRTDTKIFDVFFPGSIFPLWTWACDELRFETP